LNNEITTKYVFNAIFGMAILGVDLFFASKNVAVTPGINELNNIRFFLSKIYNWRIIIEFFLFSVLGGLYIVPLYAVIQAFSSANHRSRIIAANNLINAIFMCISALFVWILLFLGCSIPFIILTISLLNFLAAGYIYTFLPEVNILSNSLLRRLCKLILDIFYRVDVHGIENLHKAGKRVVIVSNHISYLDAALLALYLPEQPIFAINIIVAKAWWIRPLLKIVKAHPIDTNNPMAIKNLIKELKNNKRIVIFPEGRISDNGKLMKMYAGPVMIADKGRAVILPVKIDGPEYTVFSERKDLPIKRLICKVKITILPCLNISEYLFDEDHKVRLKKMSEKLYEIMSESAAKIRGNNHTIFSSVLEAAKVCGYNYPIMSDADNNVLTYRQIIAKSFILGEQLLKKNKVGSYVGLMMPNACATFVTFLAMQAKGMIPTMVNFTSGVGSIIAACHNVEVKIIYTSRKFVEKAALENLVEELSKEFEICFLEDVASQISLFAKIKGITSSFFPSLIYNDVLNAIMSDHPAVALFTSGTESAPKAVVLSHRNIASNASQVMSRLDFNFSDKMFNALPMFHCFGLGGSIIAVTQGIKLFLYPSPLHYKIIPEVIYMNSPTIMFSTDTFLNGYAKFAHPYDFYSMRYIFSGAERLKSHTKELWQDKFGIRILEGYGATETSPVISVQTRLEYQNDTVGKILPGIEYKLIPVEGIEKGGRLAVRGDNVMLGYIVKDSPGVIKKPFVEGLGEGWYDTGDIVNVDDRGFITILGRAKRFAKIGGEMVSLVLIEEVASDADPEAMYAAVNIDDSKKGEQIILFTTSKLVTKEKVLAEIRKVKISELCMPKSIIYLPELPVLATGKVNYREILRIAIEHSQSQG
jgi:acyl-[acyl-carrier-protein]-phospholipid O-acyltransferase/long-chain-fatty-acid--[acyl-carrier-protein] ligase